MNLKSNEFFQEILASFTVLGDFSHQPLPALPFCMENAYVIN